MVDRFVFVKLGDAEASRREQRARWLSEHLRAAATADVVSVDVGVPADDSAVRWDISAVIRVTSLDGFRRFAQRPEVDAIMAELASVSAVVKAWTFAHVDG